jgi:excinuclease UvrABC nuclease subunit
VYAIKKNNRIIYVGYSGTNLKKTLYRHFQNWNDREQERFVYPKTGLKVKIYQAGKITAPKLEKFLIDKYKPKDNKLKYKSLFDPDENENPYKDFFGPISDELPF